MIKENVDIKVNNNLFLTYCLKKRNNRNPDGIRTKLHLKKDPKIKKKNTLSFFLSIVAFTSVKT